MIESIARIAVAFSLLSAAVAATPVRAEELVGTWLTEAKDAQIRVARCGKAMCGTVIWLRDAADPKTGQPPLDNLNPDPTQRGRKILGIRIFAMEQDASGSWTGGIYNSDDGQTYRGRLAPRGENQLEVQGCAGALCGSEVWTRTQ